MNPIRQMQGKQPSQKAEPTKMIYLAEIISLIEIGYVDETNVMTERDEPSRARSFSNGAKLREINAIDRRKKEEFAPKNH